MTAKKGSKSQRVRARSQALRQEISRMDLVASGTIHTRTKTCGRKNCRCATDPAKQHGPYHEWSRRKDGRLVHKIVTPEQARLLQRAISNHRRIQALLAQWEEETAAEVLTQEEDDDSTD